MHETTEDADDAHFVPTPQPEILIRPAYLEANVNVINGNRG